MLDEGTLAWMIRRELMADFANRIKVLEFEDLIRLSAMVEDEIGKREDERDE